MANGRRPPGVFRVLSSAAVRDAVGFKSVGWPEASTSTGKRKRQDDDEATAAPDDGAPAEQLVMTRERLPPELAKCAAVLCTSAEAVRLGPALSPL